MLRMGIVPDQTGQKRIVCVCVLTIGGCETTVEAIRSEQYGAQHSYLYKEQHLPATIDGGIGNTNRFRWNVALVGHF